LTWDYGSGYSLSCICASGNCCAEVLDDKSLIFKKTWLPLLIQACAIAVEDDDENVPRLLAVLSQYRFGGKIFEESGPLWLKIFCALGLHDITCHSERQLRMPLLSEFADRVIISMHDRKSKRWVIPVFAIDVPQIPALRHYCKSLRPKHQEGWMFLEQQNQCLILDPSDSAAKVYCVKLKKNSWFRYAFNFVDWYSLNSSICKVGVQNSPKKKPKTHATKIHQKTAVFIAPELGLLSFNPNDAEVLEAACTLEKMPKVHWYSWGSLCEGIKVSDAEMMKEAAEAVTKGFSNKIDREGKGDDRDFPKAWGGEDKQGKGILGSFSAKVFKIQFASASQEEIRADLSALDDNETSTPALRSKSSAKKRSATPTDRVRCSDPVDSSASCCRECGLGGGVLLVTHQSTLHFCHSVNVFLAGMLQAELRRPFTSYMLRPRPGGPPQTIRVSPLQKPASKNEITAAVYRLHCCGISG
jgi:hypothetical protein